MESEEKAVCAAGRLISNATPEYLVKLMQLGTEYALSDEQRGKAEQIAREISRDDRISKFMEDFANRIDQEPGLEDFAARIRGFFLNDGRYAHIFKTEVESAEQRDAEPSGRLTPGAILTAFIVIYLSSVTLLSDVIGSMEIEVDPMLSDILKLMPWALSFPIAGSVALFLNFLGAGKNVHP